jgi:hypothetical protein
MEYCAEYQVTPPPWLLRMSADLMIDLLKREKGKKRGRAAGYIARHRQDMIDFERWNEVVVTRERQVRICEQVETCKQCLDPDDKFRIDREKMHAWLGHTWERAFECATMSLTGTHARAGVDATRRSYLRVQRAMKDPEQSGRYCQLEFRFLFKLGCRSWFDQKQGIKFIPLYDLTL